MGTPHTMTFRTAAPLRIAVALLGGALLASIPMALANDLTPPIHTGEVSQHAAFLPAADLLATLSQAEPAMSGNRVEVFHGRAIDGEDGRLCR